MLLMRSACWQSRPFLQPDCEHTVALQYLAQREALDFAELKFNALLCRCIQT